MSITLFSFLISGCGPSDTNGNSTSDTLGGTHTFYLDQTANSHTANAVLKKIVADVSTAYGSKTLKIWVDQKSFGSQCTKAKCITQEMVDALADAFLKPGEDNDIYDWDTTIYGEEWGEAAHNKYANVIEASNEINILLTDIDNDNNTQGGTIGYFYAKDNYTHETISGSNERIMFYIDSVMFANDEGGYAGWDIRDRFPSETLSTLAHEFQHMIHFYQKTVLLADGNPTDTWIDEMLAETTEDIVATRIGIDGPRGVDPDDGSAGMPGNDRGRYPGFNQAGSALSLTNWGYSIADYTKVSAFGTFLIRNYGGAKLLHDIMHNTYTDRQAVLDAIHKYPNAEYKTFDVLLREWGTAVLLSNQTTLPISLPRYNTGDFTETYYHGSTFKMGSINFFNYTPKPYIYTGSGTVNNFAPMSNLYYAIGEDISNDHNLSLDLKSGTTATLVIKKHSGTGSDTGSNTHVQISGSDADITVTVTAGDDPSVTYLAAGGHVNLLLHLGTSARDVYLVLSNTSTTGSDYETTIQNGRQARQNRHLAPPQRRVNRILDSEPDGLLYRVRQFNRIAGHYLKHTKTETKDPR